MWPIRAFLLASLLLPIAGMGSTSAASEAASVAVSPGREPPASPPRPAAYRLAWDKYVSLVAIGGLTVGGQPLRHQAWVVTYDQAGGVVVCYRATAYRDRAGNVHVDARNAPVLGPQSENWSPDSFAILTDGAVLTLDDAHPGNAGSLVETIDAASGDLYRTLLGIAMAIVNDIS